MKRINRKIGGENKWLLIERRKCTNKSCRKTHRLLPDISLPYKHYDAGVIEDVIDGTIDEEALSEEYNPSESTLQRWRKWAERLMKDLEGHMRSAAYRILGMTEEFLNTRVSLLEGLRERLNYGWLSAAMRIYINTG
ncbi:MAG: hypothetical protein IJJ31_06230 [Mogibacterium sp.]|nr:hypothetical protein [Mogibacterium sp.]